MLLVHDDEAHVCERGEQRRARAHDHVHLPVAGKVPLVEALAGRKARVQDGDVVPEAAAEASDGLGRERDLWHEDDGAFAALAHALDGVEVDLRLSRARDAVHEHDVATTGVSGSRDSVEGGKLAVREAVWPGGRGAGERGDVIRAADATAMLDRNEATLLQGTHDASGTRHHGRELGHAHGAGGERLDDAALPAGVAAWHKATPRDRE